MTLHDMCIIAPIHWGCDQTGEKCIGMEMALKHEYEILIKRLFFLYLFRKQLKLFLICESCGYIKVTIYISNVTVFGTSSLCIPVTSRIFTRCHGVIASALHPQSFITLSDRGTANHLIRLYPYSPANEQLRGVVNENTACQMFSKNTIALYFLKAFI